MDIILIHGFSGWKFHYAPIRRYLERKGIKKIHEFTYVERFGQVSLKKIASDLNSYITKNLENKEIAIIGISQGGLIAKYYIQNYKNNVKKLITVCTPFKGTWWAHLSSRPGLKDLRVKSKFTKDLAAQTIKNKQKTRFYSIWTPFDLIVFPGKTAKHAKTNSKMVLAPEHHLAFWSPGTKRFIYEALKK